VTLLQLIIVNMLKEGLYYLTATFRKAPSCNQRLNYTFQSFTLHGSVAERHTIGSCHTLC